MGRLGDGSPPKKHPFLGGAEQGLKAERAQPFQFPLKGKFMRPTPFLVALFVVGWMAVCHATSLPPISTIDEVCVAKKGPCFAVTLAQTEAERAQGLMYRSVLGPREGMLFVFDREGVYPFWMKDTLLSLDIIWISSDYRVVHIAANTLPMSTRSLDPGKKSSYVLEIVGGTAAKLGIRVGSSLKFQSAKKP